MRSPDLSIIGKSHPACGANYRGKVSIAADFTRIKTEKLLLEALEDFEDRSKEDEEWEAFHAGEYRKQTLEDPRQSRLTSAEPDADALLSEHGVSLDKTSARYKQLCRASLRGLADFYVNAEIIVKGDLENPALTFSQLEASPTQPKEINPTPTGISFAEAIKKYLTDNQSSWAAKQFESVEAKLNYFLDYANKQDGKSLQQRLLSSITSAQARAYKEHLQRTPTNAKKKYPELSPQATVEAAAKDNATTSAGCVALLNRRQSATDMKPTIRGDQVNWLFRWRSR